MNREIVFNKNQRGFADIETREKENGMKILYKDNVVTWYFNQRFDFIAVRDGCKKIRKKSEMYRFPVESVTNLFPIFDDDVETRNFLYLSPTAGRGRIGVDDKKRKLMFLLEEEAMGKFGALETMEREAFTEIELGEVMLLRDGSEEELVNLRLVNSDDSVVTDEVAASAEDFLEQIIMLEEGAWGDN